MAQITIYLNDNLESKVKKSANALNKSISKYISSILEKNISNSWNPKTSDLAGSWQDFPSISEIRDIDASDAKREEL